jgi:hypothetical protein
MILHPLLSFSSLCTDFSGVYSKHGPVLSHFTGVHEHQLGLLANLQGQCSVHFQITILFGNRLISSWRQLFITIAAIQRLTYMRQ